MMAPTPKAIDALALRIARAWMANAPTVYPDGAEDPDPAVMATVAATAAWSFFTDLTLQAGRR